MAKPTLGTHVAGRAHDVLAVALIALRPLVWSGDAGAWDNLAWLLLVLLALVWLVADAWRGRVPAWRFGTGGMIGAALLLILLPAALRSPYPATGMGLWGMAVIHLGFAAYLMQVIPGRERLAFGALIGALAVECLIALGQWAWVLPTMTAALAGGDPAVAALENADGDLANRLAYGGLFGTFTLANTLAAFLLLAAVPLSGVLHAGRGAQRLITGLLIIPALIVAFGTASKGAAVALLLAGVVVWTTNATGRVRWLALLGLIILGTAVAVIPQLRAVGAASATVRLGYWQGATALITEAPVLGYGLNGFAAHGSRAMPLDAEPTRHVHNDVLEATVDGGLLAGLALVAFLGWFMWWRPTTLSPTTDPHGAVPMWRASWPLTLVLPLFTALGMLASNLEWWPLGAGETTWWLWPVVLSGVVIGVAVLSIRLPLPPAWAWQLALTAFVFHCLVDFNLQSPAIWGTLVIVAVLAGGRRTYAIGVCPISRSVVSLLIVGMGVGFYVGLQRVVPRAHIARLLEHSDDGITEALARSAAAWDIAELWPADRSLQLALLRAAPALDSVDLSRHAVEQMPWNAEVLERHARDLTQAGRWDEAISQMQAAIDANPAYLPRRQRFVGLLQRAGEALPTRAEMLEHHAALEQLRIADLEPTVHPRNRLPRPPTSRLPIEPAP